MNPSALIFVLLVLLGILLLPIILYLSTLSKTIKLITEKNRKEFKIESSHVWSFLIPILGLILHISVVTRLAKALSAEFKDRNITGQPKYPASDDGVAFCILFLILALLPSGFAIYLQQEYGNDFLTSLGYAQSTLNNSYFYLGGNIIALIAWIIYWVKISKYKGLLLQPIVQPSDNYGDLEKLMELKTKGIITNEEFELKKRQILKL
jgi:hypothetical protein